MHHVHHQRRIALVTLLNRFYVCLSETVSGSQKTSQANYLDAAIGISSQSELGNEEGRHIKLNSFAGTVKRLHWRRVPRLGSIRLHLKTPTRHRFWPQVRLGERP